MVHLGPGPRPEVLWVDMGQDGTRESPCPCAPHWCSLEHGDEQVEEQDVGEEQVEAEQEDRQPLREGGHLPRGVALGALGLVGVRAIGAALVHVEVHAWHWAGVGRTRTRQSHGVLAGRDPATQARPRPGHPHIPVSKAASSGLDKSRERHLSTSSTLLQRTRGCQRQRRARLPQVGRCQDPATPGDTDPSPGEFNLVEKDFKRKNQQQHEKIKYLEINLTEGA